MIEVKKECRFKVQHYEYSSFGKLALITDGNGNDVTSNPAIEPYLTYTGREYDKESELYYYRARYYDPTVGRFLQVDPDAGDISYPSSLNGRYAYASNNPLNLVDPSGAISLRIGSPSFKFGSVSFNASWKSVIVGILSPAAASAKLFLHGKDSDRLDNIVIATAVIVGAAVLSPEFAVLAGASSLFKNRGTGGNFFDTAYSVTNSPLIPLRTRHRFR